MLQRTLFFINAFSHSEIVLVCADAVSVVRLVETAETVKAIAIKRRIDSKFTQLVASNILGVFVEQLPVRYVFNVSLCQHS